MAHNQRVEAFQVNELQPCHVDLRHRRPSPLPGFQHDDADGPSCQPLPLEHFDESALWTVEYEGDVVASVFGLDTHIPPCPVEEVVPAAQGLERLHGLVVALARQPGIAVDVATHHQPAHALVVDHRVGDEYGRGQVATNPHAGAWQWCSLSGGGNKWQGYGFVAAGVLGKDLQDGRLCVVHGLFVLENAKIAHRPPSVVPFCPWRTSVLKGLRQRPSHGFLLRGRLSNACRQSTKKPAKGWFQL